MKPWEKIDEWLLKQVEQLVLFVRYLFAMRHSTVMTLSTVGCSFAYGLVMTSEYPFLSQAWWMRIVPALCYFVLYWYILRPTYVSWEQSADSSGRIVANPHLGNLQSYALRVLALCAQVLSVGLIYRESLGMVFNTALIVAHVYVLDVNVWPNSGFGFREPKTVSDMV
jgi:hypothetical protein